ncbi:hypothetical protein AB0C07_32945 [Actinoplanes missouriensis]
MSLTLGATMSATMAGGPSRAAGELPTSEEMKAAFIGPSARVGA